jgi:hypothetical protein
MAVNSPASFFGQPQIMAPPPSSSIYAPNQHHFWCLPSTSSTQFECSQFWKITGHFVEKWAGEGGGERNIVYV